MIHVIQELFGPTLRSWMAGHSRSKNDAASLAYAPAMTANVAAAALLAVTGWSLLAEPAHARSGPTAANYELLAPRGAGPFPAVVVMHGCSGINAKLRRWAERLVGWGYAALIVDGFRSRGLSNICDRVDVLPPSPRAGDAVAAKAYLQSLPNIAKGLIGSADDRTPAGRCSGGAANLKVYSGATHSFDRPDSRTYLGHREIHDDAAASDAASEHASFWRHG
jgi:dienelactone hydrolase